MFSAYRAIIHISFQTLGAEIRMHAYLSGKSEKGSIRSLECEQSIKTGQSIDSGFLAQSFFTVQELRPQNKV